MPHLRPSAILAAPLLLIVPLLVGCDYEIQGLVVPGAVSEVQVVSQDDPRLNQAGLVHAQVIGTIDPDALTAERQHPAVTDEKGQFSIPITSSGAGILEYKLGIYARHTGYSPTEDTINLPSTRKRLLIVLAPGEDRPAPPPRDMTEDALKAQEEMRRN
jgi:hypothetical protein